MVNCTGHYQTDCSPFAESASERAQRALHQKCCKNRSDHFTGRIHGGIYKSKYRRRPPMRRRKLERTFGRFTLRRKKGIPSPPAPVLIVEMGNANTVALTP